MPLPSTTVFHRDWAAHVRPVNENSFNTTVTVTVPDPDGEGGWDPDTGPTPAPPITLYSGPARVTYQPTQGAEGDAVGQEIHSRRVQVTIPRDQVATDPAINGGRIQVNSVTDPNAPASLAGRVFSIETGSWSSHTWELMLDAVDDQTNQGG